MRSSGIGLAVRVAKRRRVKRKFREMLEGFRRNDIV